MANSRVQKSAPVCLIENGEDGQLQVIPEALDVLRHIEQPVVVVAVVGLYRTGKSYLMNKLAGKTQGFSLGSTIQSHTKGIWMWCVPHPTKPDLTLVLLDTEGLGDVEKGDEKNDNWIFALAVLLSSTLVYNSTGTINNNAVQQLHYVTELTEHIKVKSQTDEEDESNEFARFFPSFVWTVRDFTLDLVIDGQQVTADEYLDNSLKLKPGHNKSSQQYNLPRECIRNYFPTRKCFVFTHFSNHTFAHAQTKTMKGGYTVTGRMLGSLAEAYVKAIRSGQIPCLDNAVLALAQIENNRALDDAISYYLQEMEQWVAYPTETQEELSDLHSRFEKEAVKIFMDKSFKDDDQKFQLKLMESLQKKYQSICERNEKESRKVCESIIMNQFEVLEEKVKDGIYMTTGGYEEYKRDLQDFISRYKEVPSKGIKADEVLKDYLQSKEDIGKAVLAADKSLTEAQRRMEEEQARTEAAERENRAIREQQHVLQQQMEDQERTYRENMEQLLVKMEEDRKNAMQEQEKVIEARLKEQKDLLQQGFNDRAQQMENEISRLREEAQPKSRSWFSNVLETVGNVATLFLPGIAGKALGIGSSLISRFF
ncbi:GBP1 protein, partial [Amia calva]|nr:GBP1 protein [Amia calva]